MSKSVEELIEDLNDQDEFVVEAAAGELEMMGEESVDALMALAIEDLLHQKKNIRLNAAKILGAMSYPKSINALILTLRDNNKLVRREASTALSRMGQLAVDPLIEILDDEDWRVRGAAAWALGNLKDDAAIEPLEALLEDESGYVRAGAVNAINSIKNE